jgi:hypothetical protein
MQDPWNRKEISNNQLLGRHSREGGNPFRPCVTAIWIPAFAGMTSSGFFEVPVSVDAKPLKLADCGVAADAGAYSPSQ